jgi:hypothetical protein
MDAHKKVNHEQIQQMTKTALKKHEKVTLQTWQQTNSVLG